MRVRIPLGSPSIKTLGSPWVLSFSATGIRPLSARQQRREHVAERARDLLGTAILSISLLLAISEGETWHWDSKKTIGLLALGAVALVAFALVPTLLQLLGYGYGFGFGKTVSEAGLFLLPTVLAIVVSGILTGAGIGLALASTSNAIIESVPAVQTGEAISANTVGRTIGSNVGTAVIAAVISSHVTAQGAPMDDAFTIGFWVGVGVLAILGALVAPSMRARRAQALALGIDDSRRSSRTPAGSRPGVRAASEKSPPGPLPNMGPWQRRRTRSPDSAPRSAPR